MAPSCKGVSYSKREIIRAAVTSAFIVVPVSIIPFKFIDLENTIRAPLLLSARTWAEDTALSIMLDVTRPLILKKLLTPILVNIF